MLCFAALMLGFTFKVSLQRYEIRRQLVMADSNALDMVFLGDPEHKKKEID